MNAGKEKYNAIKILFQKPKIQYPGFYNSSVDINKDKKTKGFSLEVTIHNLARDTSSFEEVFLFLIKND